ncbi:hypothetical protein ACOI1C_10285 [Bacillus sp. DJP31]|uniref:hypothetical protein n=1 Tax=Bacillus sp. DJP31 TaxID=3409789 RepID=UPI003BB800C0
MKVIRWYKMIGTHMLRHLLRAAKQLRHNVWRMKEQSLSKQLLKLKYSGDIEKSRK